MERMSEKDLEKVGKILHIEDKQKPLEYNPIDLHNGLQTEED